jgi:hypothetical protein
MPLSTGSEVTQRLVRGRDAGGDSSPGINAGGASAILFGNEVDELAVQNGKVAGSGQLVSCREFGGVAGRASSGAR